MPRPAVSRPSWPLCRRALERHSHHGDRGGTNLVVSDAASVASCCATRRPPHGRRQTRHADAGAVLQDLVDFAIERGLQGLETLAGIPGSSAAVYGNAGAYGHSLSERVIGVRFHDGRESAPLPTKSASFTIGRAFQTPQGLDRFLDRVAAGTGRRRSAARDPAGILKVATRSFPSS